MMQLERNGREWYIVFCHPPKSHKVLFTRNTFVWKLGDSNRQIPMTKIFL